MDFVHINATGHGGIMRNKYKNKSCKIKAFFIDKQSHPLRLLYKAVVLTLNHHHCIMTSNSCTYIYAGWLRQPYLLFYFSKIKFKK